jgi:Sortase and related acyltransferases
MGKHLGGENIIINETALTLCGHEVVFRTAREEDAPQLIAYLKTVYAQSRFLTRDPDEVSVTLEQEQSYIRKCNAARGEMMLLAFVDAEHAGNAAFSPVGFGRRTRHRAEVSIALYEKYTGFGLGRALLEFLLTQVRACGYTQAELTVVHTNARALYLYESLGFRACGRICNANRYDDGTFFGRHPHGDGFERITNETIYSRGTPQPNAEQHLCCGRRHADARAAALF